MSEHGRSRIRLGWVFAGALLSGLIATPALAKEFEVQGGGGGGAFRTDCSGISSSGCISRQATGCSRSA